MRQIHRLRSFPLGDYDDPTHAMRRRLREMGVSSTPRVHYDRNRYSVDCRRVDTTVSVRAYAERIVSVRPGPLRLRPFGPLGSTGGSVRTVSSVIWPRLT